jgi:hypothetical protein
LEKVINKSAKLWSLSNVILCMLIVSQNSQIPLPQICPCCYDRGEEEARVNWLVVLREALWAYIYMRHTPNPRIEEKTILPLTIIL